MTIYLNSAMNYWLEPLQQGLMRGALMSVQEQVRKSLLDYQDQLERKREEERLRRIQDMANQITQSIPDTENTYALGAPSFDLRVPSLNISTVPSVQERVGRYLLPEEEMPSFTAPEQTSFVSVMKSPEEYQGLLLQSTLPQMAGMAAMGVNVSPMVNSLAKAQEERYKALDEEAKQYREEENKLLLKAQKFQRWRRLAQKNFGVDPETADYFALAIANGDVEPKDVKKLMNKNVQAGSVKLGDGSAYLYAYDKDTGDIVWEKNVLPDPELMERANRAKGKGAGKGGGGTWKDVSAAETFNVDPEGYLKDTKVVPKVIDIKGRKYKLQVHSKENRLRLVPLDGLGKPIEVSEELVRRLMSKEEEKTPSILDLYYGR